MPVDEGLMVREIPAENTIALRHEILRPGHDISTCQYEGDAAPDTRHFGLHDTDEALLAIVSLYHQACPAAEGSMPYRIRSMAVKATFRGQGYGKTLLMTAEHHARSRGSTLLWANARTPVIGFYLRQGYRQVSDEFVIEGIGPHHIVAKSLS